MPTPGGRGADLMIRALRVNNVRYFRGWSRMMGDPTMCRVSDDAMTMRMQFSLARCARRNIRSATVHRPTASLVTVHVDERIIVDVDICRHHAYVVSSASDLSSCEPYLTKRQQQNEKTSTTKRLIKTSAMTTTETIRPRLVMAERETQARSSPRRAVSSRGSVKLFP